MAAVLPLQPTPVAFNGPRACWFCTTGRSPCRDLQKLQGPYAQSRACSRGLRINRVELESFHRFTGVSQWNLLPTSALECEIRSEDET